MNVNFQGRDVVTFAVVIACFTLLMCGRDSVVGYSLLGSVVGYYGIIALPQTLPLIFKSPWKGGKTGVCEPGSGGGDDATPKAD
jgi:hypothetical protein